jgi:predicted nucleic acid-binding protein
VDTNAVVDRAGVERLLQAGETPVVTRTTGAELKDIVARVRSRCLAIRTTYSGVENAMDVILRIRIRGMLAAKAPRQRGLFGDGAIGATALRTGRPIITRDGKFADVMEELGAEVRRLP